MANRFRAKTGILSPFVDGRFFNRIARVVLNKPWSTAGHAQKESSETKGEGQERKQITKQVTQERWFKQDLSQIQVDSIYKTLPNAKKALLRETPEPRFLWKECDQTQQEFPLSPKEADVDVMTYLEQKDCYERMKTLQVPEFCVGSILAVTRADPYVPRGKVRFVGLCIAKNHWQNTLGATFTLRNVIDGEPMEVNFQLYSPNIQKIEVLKHEKRDKSALWYLRDYPPNNSFINEALEALPYTPEPSTYVQSKEESAKIKKWFDQVKKKKKRS